MTDRVLDACRDAILGFTKRGLKPPLALTLAADLRPRLAWEVDQLDSFPVANPGLPDDPKILGVPIRFE